MAHLPFTHPLPTLLQTSHGQGKQLVPLRKVMQKSQGKLRCQNKPLHLSFCISSAGISMRSGQPFSGLRTMYDSPLNSCSLSSSCLTSIPVHRQNQVLEQSAKYHRDTIIPAKTSQDPQQQQPGYFLCKPWASGLRFSHAQRFPTILLQSTA